MTAPLPTRSEARRAGRRPGRTEAWDAVMERPIGDAIAGPAARPGPRRRPDRRPDRHFARAGDEDLQQNICFLYHLIGGGTGDWDVPVGGMGAVSGELERAARDAGATILTWPRSRAVDAPEAWSLTAATAASTRPRPAGSSPTWPPPS